MAAPQAEALERLLRTDFHRRCRTRFFCFQCTEPMCVHCCAGNHRQLHHGPGGRPDPARLDMVRFAPCVRNTDASGCGYRTAGIQRFRGNGEKWIPILRQAQLDMRFHRPCTHCEQLIDSNASYCSFACRAEDHQGNGFLMVQHLVEFAEHLNEPIIQLDRFCLICSKAYSSTSCPDHAVHHNGPQAAAAAAAAFDTVIDIHLIDGWAAVQEGQLPAHFVENVQALEEDGIIYYPVHRRGGLHAAVPAADEAHPCQRQNCLEALVGNAHFCSLRCRHVV